MELRLPLEMSPGREAACRAVFGTWGFFTAEKPQPGVSLSYTWSITHCTDGKIEAPMKRRDLAKSIPGDVAEPGLEQDFRTSTSIVVFMFFFKLNLTQAETSY